MKQEFIIFSNQLEHIWISFLHKIPAIIVALLVLAVGIFVIKLLLDTPENHPQKKKRQKIL